MAYHAALVWLSSSVNASCLTWHSAESESTHFALMFSLTHTLAGRLSSPDEQSSA